MVLTDDNFATIESAVEEGRGIYHNIKKTVTFLLSSNLGEVISMFTAIAAGLAAPLKAVHILWINLITDSLPALALGSDPTPKGIMNDRPRDPKASLFAGGGYFYTLFYGILVAVMTLAAFLVVPISSVLSAGGTVSLGAISAALTGTTLVRAQTYAFTVLALSQLFHAVGMRDVNTTIFRRDLLRNKMMNVAFLVGFALQILATEIPFLHGVFGTVQLRFVEWLSLVLFAMLPLVFHEIFVLVRKLRKN